MPAKINREPNPVVITTKYAILRAGVWLNGSNSLRQVLPQAIAGDEIMWYDIQRGWERVPPTVLARTILKREKRLAACGGR